MNVKAWNDVYFTSLIIFYGDFCSLGSIGTQICVNGSVNFFVLPK